MKTKITLVLISILLVCGISFSASRSRTRTRKKSNVATSSIKQRVTNTSWKLIRISDEDVSGKGITLHFSKDEISGKSGVNNYFGGYKINGNRISISKLAITAMLGSDEKMNLEMDYTGILESVKRIELQGNRLILKTDSGETLTFAADRNYIPY